jgi:transposase
MASSDLSEDIEKRMSRLENENKTWEIKYQALEEKYRLLIYKRFCKSSESLDDDQLQLFNEIITDQEEAEPEQEQIVSSHIRKKKGRKPLDESLPRKETIIDIPDDEKRCNCGSDLVKIGEETSEKLHITPPEIWVERIIRLKYGCHNCEGSGDEDRPAVRIAPLLPSIIPKSIVTPGLLAFILVNKYVDHLPFYRQEKRFERIGAHISRQNMSRWQQKAFSAMEPLFELLMQHIKSGSVLQMDETTAQVLGEPKRDDTQKSYIWLARGGPPEQKAVIYEYQETRASKHIHNFLEGFKGYLQTDGYGGYDAAVKNYPDVKLVGCFAHARRKFFEASKASKNTGSAHEGLKHIQKLYRLEKVLRDKGLCEDEFLQQRKEQAEPILEKFKLWLDKKALQVPPSTGVGPAIGFSIRQWDKLIAYLESPQLTPDNNASENAIRPFVLGRKNWMFSGSPEGAKSSCGIYSLVETAKQNKVEPYKYLAYLFEKSPYAESESDWNNLLPWNVKEHLS